MLKYTEAVVGFSEVPEEIALCINISNCPIHCRGCHSPHLWEDTGTLLNIENLCSLIDKNKGITCVSFMGGDSDPMEVFDLASWVKKETGLKTCWYSGRENLPRDIPYIDYAFDYIKLGPYIEDRGGLDSATTNQLFFRIIHLETSMYSTYSEFRDETFKFRKNETDNKSQGTC